MKLIAPMEGTFHGGAFVKSQNIFGFLDCFIMLFVIYFLVGKYNFSREAAGYAAEKPAKNENAFSRGNAAGVLG